MDLLIASAAAERLGSRLPASDSSLRLIQLDPSGNLYLDGKELVKPGFVPDIAWLSYDIFALRQLPRFAELLVRSAGLQWLHTVQAGLDLPLYASLLAKNVRLTNSHVHAPALAEYVMAHVLAVFQSHDQQRALQAQGAWRPLGFREIGLSRWLIIGLGSAGAEIANRAKAFGAHVSGVRQTQTQHPSVDRMLRPDQVLRHLPEADVVVLSCPLTDATRDMVDSAFVAAMKSDSVLVNIARGAMIDEGALIDGLNRGRPGFAVLDVTRIEPLPGTSPLWTHENVRLTAHGAYAGNSTGSRSDDLFLENLRRYRAGEALLNELTEP